MEYELEIWQNWNGETLSTSIKISLTWNLLKLRQIRSHIGQKLFLAFLAISREKWVIFSRISREIQNARNVHVYSDPNHYLNRYLILSILNSRFLNEFLKNQDMKRNSFTYLNKQGVNFFCLHANFNCQDHYSHAYVSCFRIRFNFNYIMSVIMSYSISELKNWLTVSSVSHRFIRIDLCFN